MRRRTLLLLLLALCLTGGASVRSQPSIHVRGGTALPLGPDLFTEASAPGVALEIGPAFALADRLRLVATLGHRRFPFEGTSALNKRAMTSWLLSADLLAYLRPTTSRIAPFITVGTSIHRVNNTPEIVIVDLLCTASEANATFILGPCPSYRSIERNSPKTRLGLQARIGISAQLAPALRLFIQSEYAGLYFGDENLQYVPVQLGFRVRPFR